MFGLRDLFSGRRRRATRARKLEVKGQLSEAAELYAEAELPDDAARVLLLQADAETTPERRMVLCAQAARLGGPTPHGKQAARRKALLSFDLARSAAGAALHGELVAIARELEACGEWKQAAEAFAFAGDTDNEIRVLEEAGAIELLEGRLHEEAAQDRDERERRQLLSRMTDLDRVAERREALRIGEHWLATRDDDAVRLEVDRIRSRLLVGPIARLDVRGEIRRCALGSEVTIGRSNATIIVHSQAISRQHLRLFRRDGAPWVEDLNTRNGTMLGGARMDAPLPVGTGLSLQLAGQVDCRIEPVDEGKATGVLRVEIGGSNIVVPLGPLPIDAWQIEEYREGEQAYVVLRTPAGEDPPYLGGYRLVRQVELCVGDSLQVERDGPVVVRIPDQYES